MRKTLEAKFAKKRIGIYTLLASLVAGGRERSMVVQWWMRAIAGGRDRSQVEGSDHWWRASVFGLGELSWTHAGGWERSWWMGSIAGGEERFLVEGAIAGGGERSLVDENGNRWRLSSRGGELSQAELSGLRWKGAIAAGEVLWQVDWSGLRWRGAIAGWCKGAIAG